ncbi:hypothetical protein C6P82_09485 [Burkholderia multivorans]|nr:hypothetical protein C6P82_09485 [Burkholderia multivorans]
MVRVVQDSLARAGRGRASAASRRTECNAWNRIAAPAARRTVRCGRDDGTPVPVTADRREVSGISCVRRVEIQIPMLNRSG